LKQQEELDLFQQALTEKGQARSGAELPDLNEATVDLYASSEMELKHPNMQREFGKFKGRQRKVEKDAFLGIGGNSALKTQYEKLFMLDPSARATAKASIKAGVDLAAAAAKKAKCVQFLSTPASDDPIKTVKVMKKFDDNFLNAWDKVPAKISAFEVKMTGIAFVSGSGEIFDTTAWTAAKAPILEAFATQFRGSGNEAAYVTFRDGIVEDHLEFLKFTSMVSAKCGGIDSTLTQNKTARDAKLALIVDDNKLPTATTSSTVAPTTSSTVAPTTSSTVAPTTSSTVAPTTSSTVAPVSPGRLLAAVAPVTAFTANFAVMPLDTNKLPDSKEDDMIGGGEMSASPQSEKELKLQRADENVLRTQYKAEVETKLQDQAKTAKEYSTEFVCHVCKQDFVSNPSPAPERGDYCMRAMPFGKIRNPGFDKTTDDPDEEFVAVCETGYVQNPTWKPSGTNENEKCQKICTKFEVPFKSIEKSTYAATLNPVPAKEACVPICPNTHIIKPDINWSKIIKKDTATLCIAKPDCDRHSLPNPKYLKGIANEAKCVT
jgi:hypothetical protein